MSDAPEILQETNEYLAINKPAFWVVNDSATAHGNQTVQDWVSHNFDFELAQDSAHRNGIVHRLDKETSGVLLIAKTIQSFEALQKQFAGRETKKTYVALVHGELPGGGTVTAPIARMPKNRTKFGVSPLGREAQTKFELNHVYKKNNNDLYSFITLFPKTGRTHQIRVHMSHIKHPIVSDPLYVGRKTILNDNEWCPRMFLHAQSLTFLDPVSNEERTVTAPLPSDLAHALKIVK